MLRAEIVDPEKVANAIEKLMLLLNTFVKTPAGVLLIVAVVVALAVWIIKAVRKG